MNEAVYSFNYGIGYSCHYYLLELLLICACFLDEPI